MSRRPVLIVAGVAGAVVASFLIVLGAMVAVITGSSTAQATAQCGNGTYSPPSPLAYKDIPKAALQAYQQAGKQTGIDWVYIAGIGKVESDHGQFHGSHVGVDGEISPPIIGPPLNGRGGTEVIHDTDHGRYDGDTVWDRAVGPMQFIPSTWESAGRDGNGDGTRDPNNIFDAAAATAFYLRANGAPADIRAAIFAYNHAGWYVDEVMAAAASYRGGPHPPAGDAVQQVGDTTGGPPGQAPPGSGADNHWQTPIGRGHFHLGQPFGTHNRRYPAGYNTGQEFLAAKGTAVVAMHAGTVRVAGHGGLSRWAGRYVVVTYSGDLYGIYANLAAVAPLHRGQQIAAGQLLGRVGNSGINTTGWPARAHLDIQMRLSGQPVDPMDYLHGSQNEPPTTGGECDGGGSYTGPATGVAKAMIAAGTRWLGTPYSWGGGTLTGPSYGFAQGAGINGFDCSALTRYMVYQGTGDKVILPRTAQAQYDYSAAHLVPFGQMQPGDLMFWGTAGAIHHVAMYVGDGKMIEAPHTGDVVHIVPVYQGDYYASTRLPFLTQRPGSGGA